MPVLAKKKRLRENESNLDHNPSQTFDKDNVGRLTCHSENPRAQSPIGEPRSASWPLAQEEQHILIDAEPRQSSGRLGGRAGRGGHHHHHHHHHDTAVTISRELSGMWGAGPWGPEGRGRVELITCLQLLVGHGDQSVHVVGEEVGGAHVHLVI